MTETAAIERTAVVSPDGTYRYLLTRQWAGTDLLSATTTATFIMLNPSTADHQVDDPTIRRCTRFARDWGHGVLQVINLYAYRATKPTDLWLADDPVGPENPATIAQVLAEVQAGDVVVAAWGANAEPDRAGEVAADAWHAGVQLHALAVNRDGSPCHPLYQPSSAVPVTWEVR